MDAVDSAVSWPTCKNDGCIGRAAESGRCLAHLDRFDPAFQSQVDSLARAGEVDVRGTRIDPPLLDQILDAVAEYPSGKPVFGGEVLFDKATFVGDIGFRHAQFRGDASFVGATFTGDATFIGVTFEENALFLGTTFRQEASFLRARFESIAAFARSTFHQTILLDEATFCKAIGFEEAELRVPRFGPLLGLTEVLLLNTRFVTPVEIAISTPLVDAHGLRLDAGGAVRLRNADLLLDSASFGSATLVAGVEALAMGRQFGGTLNEKELLQHPDLPRPRPRLLSLRDADVANLTLSSMDLRFCRFFSTHNLDKLHLEPTVVLPRTPGFRLSGRRPPRWMWSRRYAIGEEFEWRFRDSPDAGWLSECLGGRHPLDEEASGYGSLEARRKREKPNASQLAAIYRALRKAREDGKDEPGAADFYYGEMEMRRADRARPVAERAIVTFYWLISGYGLRASRALAALLVTIGVFSVLFWQVGFTPRPTYLRALLFSAESTSSLLRAPGTQGAALTLVGELLQMAIRLLGPAFLGVAVLSLRGRVKR